MRYEYLYHVFKERIPEGMTLYQALEERNLVSEEDGPYVAFGMVVVPFLARKLQDHDKYVLQKVFSFFEEMAKSEDRKVRDVLSYAVIEQIVNNENGFLEACLPYMGEAVIALCTEEDKIYQL